MDVASFSSHTWHPGGRKHGMRSLFGSDPAKRRVLDEEPVPIKAFRRFEPYHEISEGRERRKAVVALHYEGWADKSIAHYLKIDRSTVRRVLKRWEQEGPEGLEDRKYGRPKDVQKVDLMAMAEVRRRQENPELGRTACGLPWSR
jgi:Winged helix-turn helix